MESATIFDLLIKLPGRTGQISSYFHGVLKILIHVHRYLCILSMTLHCFSISYFHFLWGCPGPTDQSEPVTEEYRRHGGVWTTSTVLLSQQQIQATLSRAGEQQNSDAIEKVVSEIPWHHEAVTAARKRWAAAAVELEAQAQKKETRARRGLGAKQRR